ncbi:Solute carrier family 2, facilitated glucose transporter member 3 [Aphelenchoides bicaudatus]|nr:Solute carrier family 2, facilitated glucose transporter member 3 [Aphelenchoides bicaudatus]
MFAPSGNRVKLIAVFTFVATLTNFLEGYSNSYPNTAGDSFEHFINASYVHRNAPLTKWEFTFYWSTFLNIWFCGYLLGTFINPIFCDVFGRKKSLLGANLMSFGGTVFSTIAICLELPELLFIGRFFCSVASGISFGALILFLQEIAPTNLRGVASSLSECVYLAVSVIGMVLGMDIVLGQKLVYLLGFAMIPAFMSILIMIPLHESPKYLLLNRKDHEAATAAVRYYQGDKINVEVLFNVMMKEAVNVRDIKMHQAFIEVFRRSTLRKAATIGILAWLCQYGRLSTCPLSCLKHTFRLIWRKHQVLSSSLSTFAHHLTGMFFIERIGRRKLLIGFGIANILTLIGYVVFDRLTYYVNHDFRYGCAGALILYGVTYGFALGPIAFFITGELVPQRFRSLVQSIVFGVNTMINFCVSFATLPLYRWIDVWAFIPLFMIPSSLSLIYLYFNMPETRGREIHEIVSGLVPRSRLPSSTNELVTESGMSTKCSEDSLSSESEDEDQTQRQPLNETKGNIAANLCLENGNLTVSQLQSSNEIKIEKF